MKRRDEIPRGVFPKNGRYYLVVAEGQKRKWHPLSRVSEGLPALFTALAKTKAELTMQTDGIDQMPALIAAWERSVMQRHAPKTQRDEVARGKVLAKNFAEFTAAEVTTPDCSVFLEQFADKPRTYNAYRSQLREYFRFAEEKGKRPPGSNPIQAIRTMRTPSRDRCPTTSEIRRVKIGCLYGIDGRRTRTGITMACLIELAYLSGQDVGVMVRLLDKRDPMQPDEPHVTEHGIFFRRDKTGNAVIIEWSPRLKAVVDRLRKLKAERLLRKRADKRIVTPCLFTKQDGTPLNYEAAANAWQKGIKRAKVAHFMLRDIRARALTDQEEKHGMRAANTMGAHSTESQTADYVRRKSARKTSATR